MTGIVHRLDKPAFTTAQLAPTPSLSQDKYPAGTMVSNLYDPQVAARTDP